MIFQKLFYTEIEVHFNQIGNLKYSAIKFLVLYFFCLKVFLQSRTTHQLKAQ
jgi:hypothetical protein